MHLVQGLPKLLYIGDVPVDSTTGGSVLLYRLFEDYPQSKLRIVEGNIWKSDPNKRLTKIAYTIINLRGSRFFHSRFTRLYQALMLFLAARQTKQIEQQIYEFQPEAIISVAHGFLWLSAAELAQRFHLPFYLIIHDDWVSLTNVPKYFKTYQKHKFGVLYRQATSRFCISPYMAEYYQRLYDVHGQVIYPLRAKDCVEFSTPPSRLSENHESIVVAYAGTLHIHGYIEMLGQLAKALEARSGQLILYSVLSDEQKKSFKLDGNNVVIRKMIPYTQLIQELRKKADVLFVPMSFEAQWQTHMKLAFPSKLADYTAIGLPLLIWGPPYSSVVRWAKENEVISEVVDEQDQDKLQKAIDKLIKDPPHRYHLAERSIEIGAQLFSQSPIKQIFYRALLAL